MSFNISSLISPITFLNQSKMRHKSQDLELVPHAKSWLIGKDSDAGREWGQEEKGTEDEMAGWHHWLGGRESEWTPGVGDGQGGLACCDSWDRKESDTTERLIWSDLIVTEEAKYLISILNAIKLKEESMNKLITLKNHETKNAKLWCPGF